jgi:hypothetical protein
MLHRIVSRSLVAFAAVGLLASCEDNTTGTPLTPPPPSTAVTVSAVDLDYTIAQQVVNIDGTDFVVAVVTPDPQFLVELPNGDVAEGQEIAFSLNLPGALESTRVTVPASGLVSPGRWIVDNPCPPVGGATSCRGVQRVIARPPAGNPGFIDVDTTFPEE